MTVVAVIKKDVEACPRIKQSLEQTGDALALSGSNVSHEIIYQHNVSERKSRLRLPYLMPNKNNDETLKGIINLLGGMDVHTITDDNGLEFVRRRPIHGLLVCESYFCIPYHSLEKGRVERCNGLDTISPMDMTSTPSLRNGF